jgi:mRNA-degrading endonuclease RelE of RelBE toxin-antitoxin system
MSYNIILSDKFQRRAKKLGKKYHSFKADLIELVQSLLENPIQGEALGKDCYKIRMAITSKNKGKSGGARLITCVKIENENIYFLSIYDKSDQSTIEDDEINDLLKSEGLF